MKFSILVVMTALLSLSIGIFNLVQTYPESFLWTADIPWYAWIIVAIVMVPVSNRWGPKW